MGDLFPVDMGKINMMFFGNSFLQPLAQTLMMPEKWLLCYFLHCSII